MPFASLRTALALLTLSGVLLAQDAEKPKEEGASSWLPILKQQAADYEISLRGDTKGRPKPLPEPVLRWTQPVRGGDDGAVFLWVADGRPQAVGTIFTYRSPGSLRAIQHEVHSLATGRLEANWRGRTLWTSDKPGLTFTSVPDAPSPASGVAGRSRQMQAIAREFSGYNVREKVGTNELRLMPKPLHRYEGPRGEVIDGALYCLAHGTDPEIFLVIEARKAGDTSEWRYALAQFSDLAVNARYKGKEVWSAPPGEWNRHDGAHAYYLAEEVDADTPEEYRKLKTK